MFELTNEQRKCFALPPVLDTWKKVLVKPGPYNMYHTYAYLDGRRITKVIQVCDEPGREMYREYGVDQMLSDDGTKLLPKTSKGKPQNFTVSCLEKKTPVGMKLDLLNHIIDIYNMNSEQSYYHSLYDDVKIENFTEFEAWVDSWCEQTGEKELAEINEFARRTKIHQKFKEGDFFRYKINRHLYGYGRVLLDYYKMWKSGVPCWRLFMARPLCVAVYHIATENPNMTPEQLVGRLTLPSEMIMDNIFYYGECEIIGNMPLAESEKNYPIHYGRSLSAHLPKCVNYQCGRVFVTLNDEKALYNNFLNCGTGFKLEVRLSILQECIKQNSNAPYWSMIAPYIANEDLRNPKFKKELDEIQKQMGIK